MRNSSTYLFLLSCLLCFWALPVIGRSTSGTTQRNVNTTDGIINIGAAPGSNPASGSWELDEIFLGFQGAVNWYLSWDDNNLYLGRLNGNNAEGSLIYLRADKTGLSFSNNVQSYDGFAPQFNNLSGINFVAYIKDSYDEFRTFSSGAWSVPNTSLVPHFGITNVGGVNQSSMEISIPWNTITNGNGKPDNLRSVFYQVVPGNLFVYGESPYGTGIAGNGPSIGVNDGAPNAAAQPGGNVSSSPQITRWWGCYPVIGGVGANGFVAVAPNAGNDIEICATDNSVTLNGNVPAAEALGTWSIVTIPPGASSPVIANPNVRNSAVSNLTTIGLYQLVWNINYGRCPATPDTLNITRYALPPDADAGTDLLVPCGSTSVQLSGNDPGPQQNFSGGVVSWQSLQGGAVLSSPNLFTTSADNLGAGINLFRYSITNGACVSIPDTIEVMRYIPIISQAGSTQSICGNSVTLSGNNPSVSQNTAGGIWRQVSGPGNAVFQNNTQYNTQVLGLQQGNYTFRWVVSNGNCPSDSSEVSIQVTTPVSASAGNNISLCEQTTAGLLGNMPGNGTGTWSQVSGPNQSSINNPTANSTTVNQLQPGNYTFQWKISSPGCPADSDRVDVVVYRDPRPFAVSDEKNICGNTVALTAVSPSVVQSTATGKWKFISGPAILTVPSSGVNTANISNILTFGEYKIAYTIYNGNCDSAVCMFTISKSEKFKILVEQIKGSESGTGTGSIQLRDPEGLQLPVQYQINYSNNEGNLFDSLPGGDYYITLRDAAGCFADTLINLPLKFFIPTGISPNGDNINDTWVIPGLNEYPDCVVTIYNQWGSLIFSSKGYQEVWDGSYQGSKLPSANYYYTIDLGKGNEPLTGKITLAR